MDLHACKHIPFVRDEFFNATAINKKQLTFAIKPARFFHFDEYSTHQIKILTYFVFFRRVGLKGE